MIEGSTARFAVAPMTTALVRRDCGSTAWTLLLPSVLAGIAPRSPSWTSPWTSPPTSVTSTASPLCSSTFDCAKADAIATALASSRNQPVALQLLLDGLPDVQLVEPLQVRDALEEQD